MLRQLCAKDSGAATTRPNACNHLWPRKFMSTIPSDRKNDGRWIGDLEEPVGEGGDVARTRVPAMMWKYEYWCCGVGVLRAHTGASLLRGTNRRSYCQQGTIAWQKCSCFVLVVRIGIVS